MRRLKLNPEMLWVVTLRGSPYCRPPACHSNPRRKIDSALCLVLVGLLGLFGQLAVTIEVQVNILVFGYHRCCRFNASSG